ncbi:methyl-accepting chemotaxis protein [Alteromonas sp. a30]|uniref:methyl-accepting chemotaxis protein n=1 Tax=Alteromonas sp. a30 TaxID=2730917 RepID=UPI002281BB24|nr:methyl-accepting chemotaxis protein [Alteromonas sp. a30]MCY7295005.1 methyl-accepting chemotaxis protein [Alteromonas sp. a30]
MLLHIESMPVQRRLTIGFGFILFLMVVLTVLGINKVNFINETLTEITDINSVKQRHAINFRGSVHDRAIAIRDVVLADNSRALDNFVDEIEALDQFYKESEVNINKMISSGFSFTSKELKILDRIDAIQKETLPLIQQIIQLSRNKQPQQAQALLMSKARPAFINWLAAINEFIDYQETVNKEATPKAREVADGFQSLMMILSAIAIVIGIIVAKVIEKSIIWSLGGEPYEAADSLSEMANGNLTVKIQSSTKDSLLSSLATMRDKLGSIVRDIVNASDELSEQTDKVVTGSSQVFNAAKKQANLTESATKRLATIREGLGQVSEVAQQTEDNSSSTTDYTLESKNSIELSAQEIERISQTVEHTVNQIRKLSDTSSKIGSITNVISDISEQTNLLALNAAIEAARAGESGRGFAVVADEVRELAKRTGDATSQIEKMIMEVQKETAASVSAMEKTQPLVENGRVLTSKTNDLLESIEQQASNSLRNAKLVTSSMAEQIRSLEDISQVMEDINQMSQDSISSLQKNNEATKSLSSLSTKLREDVAYFSIK